MCTIQNFHDLWTDAVAVIGGRRKQAVPTRSNNLRGNIIHFQHGGNNGNTVWEMENLFYAHKL
jgi:hypothetical protein